MLYDPKWEKQIETKAPDLYSRAALIAWLETKEPDEIYDYLNCRGGCLMGEWMKYCGGKWDLTVFLSQRFQPIRLCSAGFPKTYGAALGRARKFADAR